MNESRECIYKYMTDDERTCNTVENSSAKSKGVKMSKERSSKQFTRGGQIAFHDLRMFFQINKNLFQIHVLIVLVLTLGLTWSFT